MKFWLAQIPSSYWESISRPHNDHIVNLRRRRDLDTDELESQIPNTVLGGKCHRIVEKLACSATMTASIDLVQLLITEVDTHVVL